MSRPASSGISNLALANRSLSYWGPRKSREDERRSGHESAQDHRQSLDILFHRKIQNESLEGKRIIRPIDRQFPIRNA